MRKIRLEIEYDGSGFSGWQVQSRGESIQGKVEEAIARVIGEKVRLHAAGRTDAGAHALSQTAHFLTRSSLPAENIRRGANVHLPEGIAILTAADAAVDFHARFSARGKLYRYIIFRRPTRSVFRRKRAWHYSLPLDLKKMRAGAASLRGKHNFAAFSASGSSVKTTERTVRRLDIVREGELLIFDIEANGFLYKMVRNIVGTLVEVGSGKKKPRQVKDILDSRDRRRAGQTAPAEGLYLVRVEYEKTESKGQGNYKTKTRGK